MTELISLDRLSRRFGDLVAVDQVSLRVSVGEVLGFLGPNGAGKTTTMRMLAGFLEPTEGDATVGGYSVRHDPIEVKRRLGYLPEGAPLYGDMTAGEFLKFVATMRGLTGSQKRERIAEVVEMVELASVLDRPIETLSKGYKRRVGLAQAMVHSPEALVLDEPTDGLDPNQKLHVRQLITSLARDKAIIVSTHILEEVEAVCTRAVIINCGRIIADGTARDLLNHIPDHNTTEVVLDADVVDAARTALAAAGITDTRVSRVGTDGRATFHLPPANGTDVSSQATLVLSSAGIALHSISVRRGRLDEVFHRLTVSNQPGEISA